MACLVCEGKFWGGFSLLFIPHLHSCPGLELWQVEVGVSVPCTVDLSLGRRL